MARLFSPARVAGVGLLILLLTVTGCGASKFADVQGKVTYRGKPVVYGTVVVVGADQMPRYGTIRLDGTYTIKKVPVGPARFGVNSPDPFYEPPASAQAKADALERQQKAGLETPVKPPKGAWFRIPGHYGDPRTSNLSAEVVAPEVTVDLTLQ